MIGVTYCPGGGSSSVVATSDHEKAKSRSFSASRTAWERYQSRNALTPSPG